ncbi:MAG TPA: CDP-alcohol phosphatidyltransferase family protein [Candidatus Nitrosotenuis sp.]|nr:CDP-alcohol phosphatidyltransferase family protein [Candidatus Nitrosotenuis sp.]
MLTRKIAEPLHWLLYKIVYGLAATGVHPNFLTLFGFVINIWAAALFAAGQFRWAGGVMILAGLFDMVDGRVARAQNRVTKFGAFFDSTIDRYSDLALYFGLLVYYANVNRNRYAILVGIAMAGSVMVSYSRARAESVIPKCDVGFFERPERIVLLILGALADKIAPALWILAIGPNITVIHRIIYTYRETKAGHLVEVVPVRAPAEGEIEEVSNPGEKPTGSTGGSAHSTAESEETEESKQLTRRTAESHGD